MIDFKVERGSFTKHLSQKPEVHIQWLLDVVNKLIHENDARTSAISANIDGNHQEISRLTQFIQSLQLKVADIDKQTKTLMEHRTEIGIASASATSNNTVLEITQAVKTLEIKVGTFEGIVTTLYREIERCIKQIDQYETQKQRDREKVEDLDKRMKHIERVVSLWEVSKAEYENRLKALETISYEGTLIWRIENWSKVRADAVSGKVTSFYSSFFYTGRTGYKMCARLYPNGDGMGKGSHISIFFVVVRGPYDALLAWPFSHRVSFMLLDQTGKEHIVDTFRPDPSSNSFKRPTTDMNIASGCPLFMPLQKFDDPNHAYVKSDVMFLQIVVEPVPPR